LSLPIGDMWVMVIADGERYV